ncbi:RNA-directed DNA polymerase, eukaryota, reverse transcriptase zinc-binding domain protein [Tanacetum coccineum]
MMDNITASMCHKGSGRAGYARILVEIDAKKEFKIRLRFDKTCKTQMKDDAERMQGKEKLINEVDGNNGRKDMFTGVRKRQNFPKNISGPSTSHMQNNQQRVASKYVIKSKENLVNKARNMEEDDNNKKKKKNIEESQNVKANDNPPSLERIWRVNSDDVNEIKKSANEYVVLVTEEESQDNICYDDKIIVDWYILRKQNPKVEEIKNWTYDMKQYLKYRWEALNRKNDDSDEENDVMEVNDPAIENLIAKEIHGSINNELKQKDVENMLRDEKIQFCAFIETHLKTKSIVKVGNKVFGNWNCIVYASNNSIERRSLWKELEGQKCFVRQHPWVLIGDFNVTLNVEEHSANGVKKNVYDRAKTLKDELKIRQEDVDKNSFDLKARFLAAQTLNDYIKASKDEISLLQQKAKLQWLRERDKNTAFFHRDSNPVKSIEESLFIKKINEEDAIKMIEEVSNDEVKMPFLIFTATKLLVLMDSLLNSSRKLERLWEVIKVLEFRTIACCNVIYKCISKILTNRIKQGLSKIVNINQSAFIPGRHIQDNILIAQELLRGYNKKNGPKSYAMHIDIQKAYDTMNWNLLEDILEKFGFPNKMVKWIISCITSYAFSICLNGEIHGFFKGGRGLRQGYPISPLSVYSCNGVKSLALIQTWERQDLLEILPVRYLGVPLLAKRLSVMDLDYRMVVKEIEDVLLEEIDKFGWWFEQDIDGENEYDNKNKLVMVNEEGKMS